MQSDSFAKPKTSHLLFMRCRNIRSIIDIDNKTGIKRALREQRICTANRYLLLDGAEEMKFHPGAMFPKIVQAFRQNENSDPVIDRCRRDEAAVFNPKPWFQNREISDINNPFCIIG